MRVFVFIILFANSFDTFDCAKKSETFGRIVRGREAPYGQFPYAVKMEVIARNGKYVCGAALIGISWLLTAAHCVYNANSLKLYLRSISTDRADVRSDVAISAISIHPKFNWNSRNNDIALIRIPQTILFANTAIVPLPKMRLFQPKYAKAYATACGWGLTSTHGNLSSTLQYGRLQILSEKECRNVQITKNIICTAMRSDLATVCMGDSGGPLVLDKTGELIGISSYGDGKNCENGFSAIFTRVASYLDWVKFVSGIYYR